MYREKIAIALAKVAGEAKIIEDLSIVKVIDSLIPVLRDAASHGYDVGRTHQVNGGHKTEFLNKYFDENKRPDKQAVRDSGVQPDL